MTCVISKHLDFFRSRFTYDPESGVVTSLARGATGSKKNGYLCFHVRIDGRRYQPYAHQIAFALHTGEVPPMVDHINHVRSDNRWCNLRAATPEINNRNRSNSQFMDVRSVPFSVRPHSSGSWYCQINGRQIWAPTREQCHFRVRAVLQGTEDQHAFEEGRRRLIKALEAEPKHRHSRGTRKYVTRLMENGVGILDISSASYENQRARCAELNSRIHKNPLKLVRGSF